MTLYNDALEKENAKTDLASLSKGRRLDKFQGDRDKEGSTEDSGSSSKVLYLFSNVIFEEMYVIQFRYVQDTFRTLVELLTTSVDKDFTSQIDSRLAAFIVFVILMGISYLVLWLPFVGRIT